MEGREEEGEEEEEEEEGEWRIQSSGRVWLGIYRAGRAAVNKYICSG